jgi:hypothetical protein
MLGCNAHSMLEPYTQRKRFKLTDGSFIQLSSLIFFLLVCLGTEELALTHQLPCDILQALESRVWVLLGKTEADKSINPKCGNLWLLRANIRNTHIRYPLFGSL